MTDAVLLLGHGSVESLDDVSAFVANIRRGRPTPRSIVDEVAHRWKAIGGSPLLAISRAQARALEARLGIAVEVGMRLWHPYARDVVKDLVGRGVTRIVSLPVAPYSVHVYHPVARDACAEHAISCVEVAPWGEEPALLDAFADSIAEALATIAPVAPIGTGEARPHVLLTAHSLPRRVIEMGDPYEEQVRATAAGVMRVLAGRGSTPPWSIAFQSQGMDGPPGTWLGPDLPTALADLARQGVHDVVVSAIGFLADHTEVLYDIDIEARGIAEQHGIRLTRALSLNTAPRFIDALESVARRALAAPPAS